MEYHHLQFLFFNILIKKCCKNRNRVTISPLTPVQYLHSNSCNPTHTLRIPFSLTKRICTKESNTHNRDKWLLELNGTLIRNNYTSAPSYKVSTCNTTLFHEFRHTNLSKIMWEKPLQYIPLQKPLNNDNIRQYSPEYFFTKEGQYHGIYPHRQQHASKLNFVIH